MLFKSSDRKAALCSHELFLEENTCFVESLRVAVAEDIITEAWSLIFLPRVSQPGEAKSGLFCSMKIKLPERKKEREKEGSLLPERPVKSSSLYRA